LLTLANLAFPNQDLFLFLILQLDNYYNILHSNKLLLYFVFSERKKQQSKRKASEEDNYQVSKKARIHPEDSRIDTDVNKINVGNRIIEPQKETKSKEEIIINNYSERTEESESETKTKSFENIDLTLLENEKNVISGLKNNLHGTTFQVNLNF
jgi:hypothetical protein